MHKRILACKATQNLRWQVRRAQYGGMPSRNRTVSLSSRSMVALSRSSKYGCTRASLACIEKGRMRHDQTSCPLYVRAACTP